ncbi:MAG: hypothetical protein JWL73_1382, partial [Actinomycetia bacterium]|nr:hypothetical protein [Actinomycetes bacterium]
MIEREVKLLVDPGVDLPPPDQLVHDLGDWTLEEVDQRASYYDSADLRLTRADVSLRYRSDDGWTVKLPQSRKRQSFVRAEHHFPCDSGSPPAAAADLVRAWIRSEPL